MVQKESHRFTFALCVLATIVVLCMCPLSFANASKPSNVKPVKDSASVLTTGGGSAQTGQDSPLIAPGTYYIQSALPGTYMLDVSGGSHKNKANVQIYKSNATPAQRWKVSIDKDGFYSIVNVGSGKHLDLSAARARNGNNIWQYDGNSTAAQKWTIRADEGGFTILSAVNGSYAVDVSKASAKNGTNVQAYKANGTPAQRWFFIPASCNAASAQTVANGIYELRLASNQGFAIDVSGQSWSNGANVQLWKSNSTLAQRWAITWEADGYYSVKSVASGKPLDVANANPAARANIQQYANNNTHAQRWAITRNTNGSYTFTSKINGLALGLASSKVANGTNVQTALATGGATQQFRLVSTDVVPEGTYTLYTNLASNKVADIPSASKKVGVQAQIYGTNSTMAQKFQLRHTGANTYKLQNVISGKYLADVSGKVVQQTKDASPSAQQWVASFERSGVVLTNVASGNALSVLGSNARNGAKLGTIKVSRTANQLWRLRQVSMLSEGWFTLTNSSGAVLDIARASHLNGANAQVYKANGTAAQKFKVTAVRNGYYTLTNNASGKALDVKNGSKQAGANVQQYASNGTAAQQWAAELTEDGAIILLNKGSKMALEAAGSGQSGANVRQAVKSGKVGQQWSFTSTSPVNVIKNGRDSQGRKVVYLTFDDGPGPHTDRLLRVLDKYNAKATFFVVHSDGRYIDRIAKEAKAGHAVAVHSYTHSYTSIYASSNAYWSDFNRMRREIYQQTGTWTNLFRFPGGSSNVVSRFNPGIMTRLVAESKAKGYYYFDWNAGGIDAGGTTSASVVMNNAISGIQSTNSPVVLLHDSKSYSVDAVEGILRWGAQNNCVFLPLTESSPGAHHGVQN